MKTTSATLHLLCLCLLVSACSDDDSTPTPDGSSRADGSIAKEAGASQDGTAKDGGSSIDSAGGSEVCAKKAVALAQGAESGTLEARACYAEGSKSCTIKSGDPTIGCGVDRLVARWGRNEGVSPVNSFLDSQGSHKLEDATAGNIGPPFALTDFPLDTEVQVTVVLDTTPTVRLRVPFVMTDTDVTVGPVLEL